MPFKKYKQTSAYGWRVHPISKKRTFHAGIDLVKKSGGAHANIESFTSGKVIFAGAGTSGSGLGGYGNVVVLEDLNGYGHIYAHLHTVAVRIGQTVKKGELIGKQGATGNVTGAHLHYEVRKKTSPAYGWTSDASKSTVNPTHYLNQMDKGSDRIVAKLKVDGKRGPATIRRWQQFCGTPTDGVISRTSLLIKAWQSFLNKYAAAKLKVDGKEGPATIKATQKFFRLKQDGKISAISPTTKELQTFLNHYGQ